MDWTDEAKQAQQRVMAVFRARPGQALSTLTGVAELRDGLACTYEQDGHRVVADMPVAIGGAASGPTPGYFGRAAICSCIAIGIRMAALREDVRIDAIRVRIDQDWDDSGLLAMGDAPAGPLDARIAIEVESAEPQDRIDGVVAIALAHDPWLLAYQNAQKLHTALRIVAPVR